MVRPERGMGRRFFVVVIDTVSPYSQYCACLHMLISLRKELSLQLGVGPLSAASQQRLRENIKSGYVLRASF